MDFTLENLLWRVIGVGQTPCTPGLLWGADQQWWWHRYGRWRGRRLPRVLVLHATRYGPSWIFPGVWPHVQVRKKEAQFGLLNIYLCEKLFYKNRTKNVATDRVWFINRERRFLWQDLSWWWLCESCWGKKLSTSIWTRLQIYLAYLDVYDSSRTNESQTASSKFSFKKVREKKKRYIYFHRWRRWQGVQEKEREKEKERGKNLLHPMLQTRCFSKNSYKNPILQKYVQILWFSNQKSVQNPYRFKNLYINPYLYGKIHTCGSTAWSINCHHWMFLRFITFSSP